MSVLADLSTAFLHGASVTWDVVRPYKEAIFGLLTIVGGGFAAVFGAYRKQSRRPEEALSEAANYVQRPTLTRLHSDDRDLLSELRDTIHDLVRAVKRLTKVIEEQGESGGGGRSA